MPSVFQGALSAFYGTAQHGIAILVFEHWASVYPEPLSPFGKVPNELLVVVAEDHRNPEVRQLQPYQTIHAVLEIAAAWLLTALPFPGVFLRAIA